MSYAILSRALLVVVCLAFTGCNKDFENYFRAGSTVRESISDGPPASSPSPSSPEPQTTWSTESFKIAADKQRKIDITFVVDNSGSMADEQDHLAEAFASVATTYFKNPNLDICIVIITSDRYLGRSNGTYSRERHVTGSDGLRCTQPEGWDQWTQMRRDEHIEAFIRDFKTQVKVGTAGSGREHLGKSLVAYLDGKEEWSEADPLVAAPKHIRLDAFQLISFVTDEDNYQPSSASSDIPAEKGMPHPDTNVADNRRGILDGMKFRFASGAYSVVSMIDKTLNTYNLRMLPGLVGSDSMLGDVHASVAQFTDAYSTALTSAIIRSGDFLLAHPFVEPAWPLGPLSVEVWIEPGSGAPRVVLVPVTDFELVKPKGVRLKDAIVSGAVQGDLLYVKYRHY